MKPPKSTCAQRADLALTHACMLKRHVCLMGHVLNRMELNSIEVARFARNKHAFFPMGGVFPIVNSYMGELSRQRASKLSKSWPPMEIS